MPSTLYKFTFNAFQENTYLLASERGNCIIFDPGCSNRSEEQWLVDFIEERKLTPRAIVNTHAHIDHIFGVDFLRNQYKIPFHLHTDELPILNMAELSGSMWGFPVHNPEPPEHLLSGSGLLTIDDLTLEMRLTPGHSPGSVSFINHEDHWVIGGDVLFKSSIGRTDLPLGDFDTLIHSIHNQLFTLPDDYTVYSGHGEETTLGDEKMNNPFLR